MATYKKTFGDFGEWLAGEEYRKQGFKVVAKNEKIIGYKQLGEIDLIVVKGREIVFVEVKTRDNENFMPAIEAVGFQKQRKIIKAVKAYLLKNLKYQEYNMRIDVAIVSAPLDGKFHRVNIIEDAIQDTA